MNNLQVLKNAEFGEIRTVTIDNEPWFVGQDVAAALGYSNLKTAVPKHVSEEDRQIIKSTQNGYFEIPTRGLTIIYDTLKAQGILPLVEQYD